MSHLTIRFSWGHLLSVGCVRFNEWMHWNIGPLWCEFEVTNASRDWKGTIEFQWGPIFGTDGWSLWLGVFHWVWWYPWTTRL